MTTTLIKHGTIVDGTGTSAFAGSVLIEDDRIAGIVPEGAALPTADRQIDAQGLVICPGFIDMHSHADWVLPLANHAPILKCLVEQGITTVVAGNCGISPAPMTPEARARIEVLASIVTAGALDYPWRSMAEYLTHVENQDPLVNMAQLVGHATVRYANSRRDRGDMSPRDLERCMESTRQALDEGACGLSFGLGYDPGMYASLEELEAFSRVAAEAGKPVTIHMKALSRLSPCYPLTMLAAHNIKALQEALLLAEKTGAALQLSHFIFVGRKSWSTVDEALDLVEGARARGVDVMIDAFPYTCGNTTILAPVPYWFLAKIPGAYSNALLKARLRLELAVGFRLLGFSYPDFQVMDSGIPGYEDLNGLRITEIAEKWNCSPFTAMLTLAEKSRGATLMLYHTYSGEPGFEEPLEKVLSRDYCLFETDAAIKANGLPNPSATGTFPRILGRFVRDRKLFSLEEAVRRMTHASAERFGLKDVGCLAPGKAADLVLFDPRTIADNPGGDRQAAGRPEGIRRVLLNGQTVVNNGIYVEGVRPGRVLKA